MLANDDPMMGTAIVIKVMSSWALVVSTMALAAGATHFTDPSATAALDLSIMVLSVIGLVLQLITLLFSVSLSRSLIGLVLLLLFVLSVVDYCTAPNESASVCLVVFGCLGMLISLSVLARASRKRTRTRQPLLESPEAEAEAEAEREAAPAPARPAPAPELAQEARPELPPFNGVVDLVADEIPSLDCQLKDGYKAIPFLHRVAEQDDIPSLCKLDASHQGMKKFYGVIFINFQQSTVPHRVRLPDRFQDAVEECKPPLIMMEVVLFAVKGMRETGGHANLIVIDKALKEIERFEPHGGETGLYQSGALDDLLQSVFETHLPGYRYLGPMEFCPRFGPQTVRSMALDGCDSGGFCAAWATMYGHLRLLNPSWPRDAIVREMMYMVGNRPLFMKRYVAYIDRLIPDSYWSLPAAASAPVL